MQMLIHRMDQTAHISLQLPAISKSAETKSTECALTYSARPASSVTVYFASRRLRRSVEGCLRRHAVTCKGFFCEKRNFCGNLGLCIFFNCLMSKNLSTAPCGHNILARDGSLEDQYFAVWADVAPRNPDFARDSPKNPATRVQAGESPASRLRRSNGTVLAGSSLCGPTAAQG